HRAQEVLARRLDIAAGQFVLVGEGDGVHHEIDLAPKLCYFGKNTIHRLEIRDVAMPDDGGAKFRCKRFDALFQRLTLIGQGDFRTLCDQRFCDAPGDRAVIGNTKDNSALASHEAIATCHSRFSEEICGDCLSHSSTNASSLASRRRALSTANTESYSIGRKIEPDLDRDIGSAKRRAAKRMHGALSQASVLLNKASSAGSPPSGSMILT